MARARGCNPGLVLSLFILPGARDWVMWEYSVPWIWGRQDNRNLVGRASCIQEPVRALVSAPGHALPNTGSASYKPFGYARRQRLI